MIRYHFKNCRLDYYPEKEYCETVFQDGTTAEASPMDTDDFKRKAREYGYGDDLMLFCLHHEMLHTLIAEARGEHVSPTLKLVADHETYGNESLIAVEEATVMRFQRFLGHTQVINRIAQDAELLPLL